MTPKPLIFIVEDDDGIRNMMAYTLRASGFEVGSFAEGMAFFAALALRTPALVLLDIMLPGESGMTILGRLREAKETARIPVIMASAKGTEYDRVVGLDRGADEDLVKPLGMMEMVSRVKAVLRRVAPTDVSVVLEVGDLCLDVTAHHVRVAGDLVSLTFKEFELLRLFLENPGQVFSRDRLLSAVWGVDFMGESRTVDVHIATLRDKLGPCGELIETVRGVGYRLGRR
ncbi:MAG: response regulator transcription factor [Clostridia bacterium]|nr:response regulator transcription factor [Clostridia bacterium]